METKKKILTVLKWIALIICIILPFFPYNWWFNGRNVFSIFQCINVSATESLSYGELGDFIGGLLGTIIAGIACIYVYKTYISQKKESRKTNETAEIQQFESSFFNLIHIYRENLESLQSIENYISDDIPETAENGSFIEYLKEESKTKTVPKKYKKYVLKRHLRGADAMLYDYSNMVRDRLLPKYYYSSWFNSMCMIMKYLNVNKEKIKNYNVEYLKANNERPNNFYVDCFYSQIPRPGWWILYGIYLYGEELKFDKYLYYGYVNLINASQMFDYGIDYISEKYIVASGNLYDRNFNHKKL